MQVCFSVFNQSLLCSQANPVNDDTLTINCIKIVQQVLNLPPDLEAAPGSSVMDTLQRLETGAHLIRLLGSQNAELVEVAVTCLHSFLRLFVRDHGQRLTPLIYVNLPLLRCPL